MASLTAKQIIFLCLTLIMLTVAMTVVEAQKKSKGKSSSGNGQDANSIDVDEKAKVPFRIYQNASLPFNERFGTRPRDSSKFHYPALPDVYWRQHKRPQISPWDPSVYPDPESE